MVPSKLRSGRLAIAEFTAVLEAQGLETTQAVLFDRPTDLEGPEGLRNWVRMFGQHWLSEVEDRQQEEAFLSAIEDHARAALFREGTWLADYRRLRVLARKVV